MDASASKEIKSPELVPGTPPSFQPNSESQKRKKLGIYFIESDDRRTAFGGGYMGAAGGATPVNIHGKPISNLSKTGGWVAAFFIFGIFSFSLPFDAQSLIFSFW